MLKLLDMRKWKSYIIPGLWVLVIAGWFIGRHYFLQPKAAVGELAPDFNISTADSSLTLKNLQGSYVLIQFWGSWCGPCRKENPDLVKVFEKYQNARFDNGYNFNIVGVAVEKNADHWKAAIRQDRLRWTYHVLDLVSEQKATSPATLYGVTSIPSNFLLDGKGRILARNLLPDALDQFLKSKLE